jgi:hypothetical protein
VVGIAFFGLYLDGMASGVAPTHEAAYATTMVRQDGREGPFDQR